MSEEKTRYDEARNPAYNEPDLLDFIVVIAGNLRLLMLGPFAVGIVALGVTFLITPTYTAKMQFLPPQQSQSTAAGLLATLGSLGGLASAAGALKNPAEQYVSFVKSASVQNALVTRFDLTKRYASADKDRARRDLSDHSRIQTGKDGIISIEVEDHDPRFAADLANAYAEELQKLLSRLAVTEAQQRRMFFEKHLADSRDRLAAAERALSSAGVNRGALNATPLSAVEAVARLKAGLSAQEVKLNSMRSYVTESAPEFRQALNDLAALKRELEKQGATDPGQGGSDYIGRYREFKYQETLFEIFAKQYELAKIEESREGPPIQIIDVAQAPDDKTRPRRLVIVLIVALIAAVILAIYTLAASALRRSSANSRWHSVAAAAYRSISGTTTG